MSKRKRQTTAKDISDQTVIEVDRACYDEFLAILDRPAQPNDRLRKTLQTPAPWES
ncbi:MAG TPA: DUF1778 domain-containing protein [Allosphingosinicella sp.]|nr:DUF1778 domain-containing protein [Allosphingosinicella sp.]